MRAAPLLLALAVVPAAAQQAEKQLVLSISGPDLRDGIISEITWDEGALMLQGVFAGPDGALQAEPAASAPPAWDASRQKAIHSSRSTAWRGQPRTPHW